VIAPEINPSTFHIATSEYDRVLPSEVEVVVALNVDEQGNAHDLKVVKSVNPEFDARVIDAVQKSHFRPAKLDNQVVAYGMNLKVVVQR
jgi:TonB family protein